MRFTKYFPLACALVSVVYAAPMTAQQGTSGQTPRRFHLDVTIVFEQNPMEGIHADRTVDYTIGVQKDVRKLVVNFAKSQLGAPRDSQFRFSWRGTPNPDTAYPVEYDVLTKEHGTYKVVMSHQNPFRDVVVKDSLGRPIVERGDPYKNP
ncbi:hypothetical protein EV361DRAFT_955382 [Lentinula raphanica]|uniref:FlgD Ig-like domain-containing protein n=1 Tax=Lentinula raphanica TaxID=153919 RepID=A0AA38UFV0_9AGAR|nr:hypothetical protein F5880DRAFT_1134556 [Lentinula raphanica]KAJ3836582.1 hypothetical protein F5878DRAFT_726687 [Lentinula raphanica]KAJ3965045.1 hypothetical protein EV361DRAFT_955382 [Lentinula raphanica]